MEHGKRLWTLDGLRGIAAVGVVAFHMPDTWLARSGYLAVDFFFLLSGVVVARAYDSRLLNGMPLHSFLSIRVIRLYPLYFLGLLIGLIYATGQIILHRPQQMNIPDLSVSMTLNLFFVPSLATAHISPVNGPAWSLMLELLINIVYAAFLFKAQLRTLVTIVFVCGLLLVPTALSFHSLNIGVIWSNLFGGLLRVGFSFTLGVIIARLHPKTVKQSWLCVLLAALLMTVLIADPSGGDREIFDLVVVIMLGPLIVWLGASYNPPPFLRKACAFLGEISYPLYAIHYPTLLIVSYGAKKMGITDYVWMPFFLSAAVVVAYGLGRFLDEPARQWLTSTARSLRFGPPRTAT